MTTLDKIAAWNNWCESFLNSPTIAMTKDDTLIFYNMLLMEMGKVELPVEVTTSFLYQVLEKRAEFLGVTFSKYVLALLSVTVKSVGVAVMYITALAYYSRKNNKPIDIVVLSTNIFPFGFLSEKDLEVLWDAQKCRTLGLQGDNLLDQVSAKDLY